MKIRGVGIGEVEHIARAVLIICAAVAATLVLGAALVLGGMRLYGWASEQIQAHHAAQVVEFYAVRTKPARTEVVAQTNPGIDAGPFDSRSVCERYTALMNRYSHYAVIAKQYHVWRPLLVYMPGDEFWMVDLGSVETVDRCQALRRVRGTITWPLGTSLEEAQKPLRELLANMKQCYTDWVWFDALPRDDWRALYPPHCSRPPKDWADLPNE